MSLLRTLVERRDLLANLVSRELKIRYRGSVLGFLWSILIPLFMALIYILFLRILGGRDVPIAEIIIGVFAWQFTVQSVNGGLTSITGSVNLVKKVYFPRLILPVSVTLANLANYLLSLLVQFPLLAVLMHYGGGSWSPLWPLFPLVLVFHCIFNLGLTFLMAAANVYLRDTQHLVGVALSAWFFVSPVMYNLSFVERLAQQHPGFLDLFMLNPLSVIVTAYRATVLADIALPVTPPVLVSVAISMLLCALAYRIFQRAQRNFADLL